MPESAPDTPERLLERHLAGDDAAFEDLVGRYEERLYAFIVRMIGDPHLSEDVFQQVWLKVAGNAAAFDGRASFSTWLFRIARNAALDEIRKRQRFPLRTGVEEDIFANRPDRSAVAPLEKLTRDELAARIRAALETLPDTQREVFLLKEEADLDFGEIGEVLGCGRETAKSRFRLALGKLRLALGMDEG